MKQFKTIDFWISVGLIIFFSCFALFQQEDNILAGYFVVGAWQVISILVHYYKNWFCLPGSQRSTYQSVVIIIFIMAAVGFFINPVLYVLLFILVFAAPLMAVFYTWLCYKEVYIKMQRPLALLK